ncbi:hypothetical protein A2121_00060 [Candidatus Nomurabacteria bacterium GWB1_40_6]|uniref:Uncharacterized protein n=1 Tax=Candidatus Nomurabacteria bacterium GWB1_40_6 TaxID=1801727 RepID=A0A1F6TNN7_9BACT|nr:MAG: hypothetical protein A2121_00060 [Candidatus Nomurabacteria bacterium GWB1_40_6]
MNQEKKEYFLKTPFFKYFLPVLASAVSVYLWINFLEPNFLKIAGLVVNLAGLIIWWTGKLTLA